MPINMKQLFTHYLNNKANEKHTRAYGFTKHRSCVQHHSSLEAVHGLEEHKVVMFGSQNEGNTFVNY